MMWLAVAIGGALGAMGRYAVMSVIGHWVHGDFPWGTLVVNIAGSFLMGALIELLTQFGEVSLETRAFFTVGLLGAFTTFSTFSLDVVTLYHRDELVAAGIYVVASVVLCIAALLAGISIFRMVLQ